MDANEVLNFWFREIEPSDWWKSDPDFDERIRQRFGELLQQASAGELFEWRLTANGRLAEIIVLDQFSRNVHRGAPASFAQDPMALALSQEAVAGATLSELNDNERAFLLMPYMHSESRLIHVQADRLFREHAPAGNHAFELKHKEIIDRFERYPHRNEILGRRSTDEEIEFLKQPGSSF